MSNTRYIVTTAPDAYDYATATTVRQDARLRLVQVATERDDVDYLARYQADRYMSGMYAGTVHATLALAVERFGEVQDLLSGRH